ncbi:similar to An07g04360 [Aspergillus luchuensis IFO 4308]|nr:similar to An07g04360 [Aspergillus luchuensis IFO 4308]
MRLSCALFMLLAVGVYSADLGGRTAKALSTAAPDQDGQDLFLIPQNNYNGWVNPEDLRPMPQCIAQQDQSTWLEILTKCTAKRCTSHFGFICTHHQWLTHLGCLSVAFSSDVIAREWLVEVGDTNELQNLSPASLAEGYSTVDVLKKAPGCLTGSVCSFSREPFQRVMASCRFTSASHHTGNAARPWEYNEPVRSIIALDSETVGYDLVQQHIKDGYYFDKDCFCSSFAVDFEEEPCSDSERLDWTKQRLWLNATCGSKSLPDNWTDALLTTQFAFIALEGWSWPKCVMDMPKKVTDLTDQCAADASMIPVRVRARYSKPG